VISFGESQIKLTCAFGCLKRTSNDRLKQMKTMLTLAAPRSEKLSRRKEQRYSVGRLTRFLARPPFCDALGHKGWFSRLSRAESHVVHHLGLKIPGWPRFSRPMRIAFLSDFHTGSHSDDVTRLNAIIAEASAFRPDLALFGGDYVNMQLFGGGRVPPRTIATAICRLDAALGQFAVLGNHDYEYGALAVAGALEGQKINVLSNSRVTVQFQNNAVNIIGVPNARITSTEARAILAGIEPNTPTIVLAHDPVWFAEVPSGPHLTLAGHTHGGQIRIPGIGVITNASKAPLRWSNGLISERGKHLYVTSGIGTSGIPLRWGVPPGYAILDVIGE
jgi:predicted MPP superfamily phosphohydrolase